MPLSLEEEVPIGRKELLSSWGTHVSRTQFTATLIRETDKPGTGDPMYYVRIVGAGLVNKTVVNPSGSLNQVVVDLVSGVELREGDSINLENQDASLALLVEWCGNHSQSSKGKAKTTKNLDGPAGQGGCLERGLMTSEAGAKPGHRFGDNISG